MAKSFIAIIQWPTGWFLLNKYLPHSVLYQAKEHQKKNMLNFVPRESTHGGGQWFSGLSGRCSPLSMHVNITWGCVKKQESPQNSTKIIMHSEVPLQNIGSVPMVKRLLPRQLLRNLQLFWGQEREVHLCSLCHLVPYLLTPIPEHQWMGQIKNTDHWCNFQPGELLCCSPDKSIDHITS